MNNQPPRRATSRRLLILIGPAAVVGERFALEEFLIIRRRLVHNHQRDFAVQVDLFSVRAFEIVPVVFRCANAVADKHDGCVKLCCVLARLIFGDNFGSVIQINRLAACGLERKLCLVLDGMHGKQRHLLEECPVVSSRLNARQGKLRRNVLGS